MFAASIAPSRIDGTTILRAALLFDAPSTWRASLPSVASHAGAASAGHTAGVSYAKCVGGRLPNATQVLCRIGSGLANATWREAKILRYKNSELQHELLDCPLGAPALRWRRLPGPPPRVHIQVGFELELMRNSPRRFVTLPLELCRVDAALHRVSFCSQPLYGYRRLGQELPYLMDDWLDYHMGRLGVERADIYDVEGSAAEAVQGWKESRRGHVVYHHAFPASISQRLATLSKAHPYCAETWAYVHCATNHRALSRWVVILHAPDEYLVLRRRPDVRLPVEIERLERIGEEDAIYEGMTAPISQMAVRAVSFKRGGAGALPLHSASQRGAILASAAQRAAIEYPHTPIIDPDVCAGLGPHTCYAEANTISGGIMQEVRPNDIVLHHYVEMLGRDQGRCETQHRACNVPDTHAMWIVDWLRSL